MFPWEIDSVQFNNFFEGPYLFSAIYRVYKGAYFGQRFQLCGPVLRKEDHFQKLFDKFPLEIKGIILNKIWNYGCDLGIVLVLKGELLLQSPLHFLFSQYGRLKEVTWPIISMGCGTWNGTMIKSNRQSKQCIFEYGPSKLKNRVIIPIFLIQSHINLPRRSMDFCRYNDNKHPY